MPVFYDLDGYSATVPPVPGTRPNPTGPNRSSAQFTNLVAWWPLWLTSTTAHAIDLVNGLTGTPTSIKIFNDPVFGGVFQGDGTVRNYKVPYSSLIDFGGTQASDPSLPFSVSAWVNISISATSLTNANSPPNAYIFTFDVPSGAFPGYGFAMNQQFPGTGNNIMCEFDVDSGSAQVSNYGNKAINDGKWHHLCCTYNAPAGANQNTTGIISHIYVDGVQDVQSDGSLQNKFFNGVASANGNPLWIGTDDTSQNNAAGWQGLFCDIRIYSGVLPLATIQAMQANTSTQWDLYA